jgi:hypothetical protein
VDNILVDSYVGSSNNLRESTYYRKNFIADYYCVSTVGRTPWSAADALVGLLRESEIIPSEVRPQTDCQLTLRLMTSECPSKTD